MPTKSATKPRLDSLHTYLADQVRAHRDDPAGAVEGDALFRQFLVSGLDYKGQLSTGFAERGKAVQLEAGFDFGDLIAPGVLTAEVTATFRGQKLSHSLMGLLHQGTGGLHRDRATRPAQEVLMFVLSGVHMKLDVAVEAEVGVGIPSPLTQAVDAVSNVGPDCLAASLEASGVGTAGVTYAGSYLFLKDPSPQWFNESDTDLMKVAFVERVGPEAKDDLRQTVGVWLKKDLGIQISRRRHKLVGSKYYATEDLLSALTVAAAAWRSSAEVTQQIKAFRSRLEERARLEATPPPDPTPPRPPRDELCFLSLWGHEGGASAGIGASLEAGLEQSQNAAGISAQASVGLEGSLKRTSYRLQTTYENVRGRTVVVTQDTVLTYRQAELAVSATATAELEYDFQLAGGPQRSHEWEGEWSRGKAYNQLTYRSSTVLWKYADAKHGTDATMLQGSGIAYGISVLAVRLILAARHARGAEIPKKSVKSTDNLIKVLAWRLRVGREYLESFLSRSIFADLETTDATQFAADVLLLEACFPAPAGAPAPVRKKPSQTLSLKRSVLPDMHKAMHNKSKAAGKHGEPLAIRARYRIADARENETTKFQLGVSFVVDLGIQLDSVENAGQEGVIDIATHFFGTLAAYDIKDKRGHIPDRGPAFDQIPPAVALVHQ